MINSIFIAGLMQGSRRDDNMHSQDYREDLKRILRKRFPGVKITCPFEENPNSLGYSDDYGRRVFLKILQQAAQVDLLIAYLPEASMGTALEMWEAYRAGVRVWAISPLKSNWVVKFFSHRLFDSIEDLQAFLQLGFKPVR